MAEMIERVARAILAAHDWTQNPVSDEDGMQVPPDITGWDALTPDWQECLRGQARAAIEAMKITDTAEGVPGGIAFEDAFFGNDYTVFHAMTAGWNATIDAALSPLPASLEE